ncbi:hypothetical protein [Halanaerobium kushneri]|uniref:ParB-like nuclease domain-containing protein n=1 Tax=Halanaerobium kushneri TaxID=56779 RepID=A0A1N6PHF1_9FIRM|nr:hypothetical protein [Halanaerobium kushneri]SIQ03785.1 hypothetical protein SAMN05421834_10193 [Halanaerobium kushneri]
MKYWHETIKIPNLFINTENPRFEIADSQKEAIENMIENQNQKLYRLAVDIIESGLNPSDLPIVTSLDDSKNRYRVLEGNRRITALKLLLEPNIASSKNNNLKKKFKRLNKQYDISGFEEITCVAFEEEADAIHWIEIKHSGQLDGIGTVTWDATSKRRFERRLGKSTKCLQVLEFIKESDILNEETKNNFNSIAITNLERLISDPAVREFLGIEFIDGNLHIIHPKEEVFKGLAKVIKDLVHKNIIVDDIYYKDDRANYLENFDASQIPNTEVVYENPKDAFDENKASDKTDENNNNSNNNLDSKRKDAEKKENNKEKNESKENNDEKRKPKSKRRSFFRHGLIPSNCILEIEDKRINKIYMELKKIEVEKFPNLTAVSFRVFLELSLDHYIEENNLENISIDSRLSTKVQKVAEDLKDKDLLTDQELKPVNVSVSNPDSIISINTFNAYVHNKNMQPIAKDLKINWERLENYFKGIWNN